MSFRSVAVGLFVSLLLLGSLVPTGTAQAAEPASVVKADDTPGDVMLNAGTRAGVPPQNAASQPAINTDHLDILGVSFTGETDTEFQVHLKLKALEQTQTPVPVGFAMRAVTFRYGEIDWQIRVGPCQGRPDQPEAAGCLGYRDGGGREFRSHQTIVAEANAGESAYIFHVPKEFIFDQDRVPGRHGARLYNISANTYQWFFGLFWFPGGSDPTGGVQAVDRAPDGGVIEEAFEFVKGSGSRGHLAMTVKEPLRVSNGEATTIVYKVLLWNDAEHEVTAELFTEGTRSDWTTRVPSLVKIPSKSNLTIPVILALPFTHEHGKTATFQVKARDVNDANSYSSVDLGVFWTDIPQPSAHHNGELWFHSAPFQNDDFLFSAVPQIGGFVSSWINSIEDDPDPATTDVNVGGFPGGNSGIGCAFQQGGPAACSVPPENRVNWFFPLSPRLLIGLDFDTERQGRLVVDILPKVAATNAQLTAQLFYCDPDQQNHTGRGFGGDDDDDDDRGPVNCNQYNVLLASGFMTRALTANQAANFDFPLNVEPAAEFLPYKSGANFALRLTMVTDTPQTVFGAEPRPEFVTKTGRLYLPLIEYHDPVAAEFQNVGSLKLEAMSGFEKKVNPGETTIFTFNLTNQGKQEQKMTVQLDGINKGWATLNTATEFPLRGGETKSIAVAIAAPVDAQDGESAELFLVANSLDDQSVVTVTRMRATVVAGEDIADEGAPLEVEKKKTPGPGVPVLLLAAAVLVLLRRRR